MDDARTSPRTHPAQIAAGFLLAVVLGAGLGLAAGWYLAPHALDRFAATRGELHATGWSGDEASGRISTQFTRDHDHRELVARGRRELRSRLSAAIVEGPLPNLTRSAECAASLAASANVMRALAAAAPEVAPPSGAPALVFELRARDAFAAAVAASDAAALESAMGAERRQLGAWLERSAASLDPAMRTALWPAWRTALLALADEHDAEANAITTTLSAWLVENMEPNVAVRALAIEPQVPDPSAALARHPVGLAGSRIEPLREFWSAVAGAGAALGAFAFGVLMLVRRARRGPAAERAANVSPADARAWLHVVAGGQRERIARGVCEVVAHALARRERIVVVDAARALRLHASLKLSARLGFVECMTQNQPALGLLQGGGFTGLFLLARGRHGRITDWLPLDRVLEELRPHFDRVVLAFEADVPAVVGGVLAGRMMQGWWAGPGSADDGFAERVAGRLAIALSDMDLSAVPKASLEVLEQRLAAIPVAAPAPVVTPATALPGPIEFRVSPPAVLDCDLQIRQKLRFLAWMRRMRTEKERPETAGRS